MVLRSLVCQGQSGKPEDFHIYLANVQDYTTGFGRLMKSLAGEDLRSYENGVKGCGVLLFD